MTRLVFLCGLIACAPQAPVPPPHFYDVSAPYSPNTVKAFMGQCLEASYSPSYCSCVLLRLNRRMSETKLLAAMREAKSLPIVQHALEVCQDAQ